MENVWTLSVREWRALSLEGTAPDVRICLYGDSMRPLVRRGRDHVTITPLTRALKKGDVVLFARRDGRYVVHRVRRLRVGAVETLGDACRNPDGWMPADCIWGLVTRVERGGRAINLDTPFSRSLGRVWMALLPLRRLYYSARRFAGRCYHALKRR